MKINRLVIENFKSIERIELIEPNPFTVFVGPNGSGKSTIFEALEFFNISAKTDRGIVEGLFGGPENFLNRKLKTDSIQVGFKLTGSHSIKLVQREGLSNNQEYTITGNNWGDENIDNEFRQLVGDFSRLFISNEKLVKLPVNDNQRLSLSAKNLEKVLKRVLADVTLKNETFEWLELFVPEFKSVAVVSNPFSGEETLLWSEKYAEKPFTKDLISDGTYNILALLTAVYQSEEPQFLCIEEPENGLHPQVVMVLVDFFRQQCEEKGHYIWLNTHSESLVRKLTPNEIILVDKREGATKINQVGSKDFYDLQMDEAWLTGALGGGLPW